MALESREKILIEEVKVAQDIIKRMAGNSFSVKTWAITLIVATLLFKGSQEHIFIAFVPLFAFWFLDAYYLQQERLFREVHNWAVGYRLEHDDDVFNMNPERFNDKVDSVFCTMFSISVLPFYGGIFAMLCVYIVISYGKYFSTLATCISTCLGGK